MILNTILFDHDRLGGKHENLAANFIVATTAAVDQKIFIFRLLV